MTIEAGDFRTGLTLLIDGKLYVVLDFLHVKPGKGAAILRTKLKDLRSGTILEKNFNTNTKFEQALIEKKPVQFSYSADTTYYFMDVETYEMYELSEDMIESSKDYLLEGMQINLTFFEGEVITVLLPEKVELTVIETTDAISGASNTSTKDAIVETGLRVRVPQFIKEGDKIIVSTFDGSYYGRA